MTNLFRKGKRMYAATTHDRLVLLCERLSEATVAREIEWQADGEDRYLWEHDAGAVSIGARDGDGEPPYDLAIFDRNRRRVEELASALVDGDEPAAWNPALAGLYKVARRSGLRADDIIEALIAALPQR